MAFALSDRPITITNPIRTPTPLTPITIIVTGDYARFRRMAASAMYRSDDCVWMASFAIAQAWVDRCLDCGIRLEAKWVITS